MVSRPSCLGTGLLRTCVLQTSERFLLDQNIYIQFKRNVRLDCEVPLGEGDLIEGHIRLAAHDWFVV
jgi:hypothetical protein